MPNLPMPEPGTSVYKSDGLKIIQKLAQWGAPFSLRADQWEELLYSKDYPVNQPGKWRNLPAHESPLMLSADGKVAPKLSPFGAVDPWYEAGEYYTGSGSFDQLQRWYPDPPLVILLSNNEARRLKPKDGASIDKRYVDQYGTTHSPAFEREVMAEGYLERYRALLKGMKDGLQSEAWKEHSLMVGYNAVGPSHFGRWGGWPRYSFATEEQIDPWYHVWGGASASYYTNDWNASTDYQVFSPQVEAMNWVFMLEEVYREKPDFWFELSIWDGNWGNTKSKEKKTDKAGFYQRAGQQWSAERYAGFVQYGMWLTTPRVVREFKGHSVPRAEFAGEFEALVAAVDRVWENPILTAFWRKGALVPNRTRQHPYQVKIPSKWKNVDRWFMLNTSLDKPGKWSLKTEIPVFTQARVIGEKGHREWLLYAHAPVQSYQDVQVEIPEYDTVTVDVTPGGNFYLIREQDRSVTAVTGSF